MLAKESVAPSRRSSAGWMTESMGKWFIVVGRRHPMTLRRHDTGHCLLGKCGRCDTILVRSTQLLTRDGAAVRNVLAPEPHSELTSRFSSATR